MLSVSRKALYKFSPLLYLFLWTVKILKMFNIKNVKKEVLLTLLLLLIGIGFV